MRQLRVVIVNGHSVLNTGDTAIALGQVRVLRELLNQPEIIVTSRTPARDAAFYRSQGVNVLPAMFPAPSMFVRPLGKLVGCTRNLVAFRSKLELLREIRCADLVVAAGGGYLYSNRRLLPGPMFWQSFAHVWLAERMGKEVVFAPQSFGPFLNQTAARAVRHLLTSAAVRRVFAREAGSLDVASALLGDRKAPTTLALCPDMAFYLDHDTAAGSRSPALKRPVLGVTARQWDFPESQTVAERRNRSSSYLATLVQTCSGFVTRHDGSVLIFAQARGPGRFEDDRMLSAELGARLAQIVPAERVVQADLAETASPEEVLSWVGTLDILLASRFHSVILALLAEVPVVCLGYQPKSAGMMATLGLERFCLPMAEATSEVLGRLLDEVLNHRGPLVQDLIRPGVATSRERIASSWRLALAPWLDGGGSR